MLRSLFIIAMTCYLAACDMFGAGKVSPVVKSGPPIPALEVEEDIQRVAALVPKDNEFANRTTSVSLTIAGSCITDTLAVKVSAQAASVNVTVDCDPENNGAFSTEVDLSSAPDGEIPWTLGYFKTRTSTSPVYELTRVIIKDVIAPDPFSIGATLSESAGAVSITAVPGAVSYRAIFTPAGGGDPVSVDSSGVAIPVKSLTVGTTYSTRIFAIDDAGNETESSNTATFTKVAPSEPTGLTATAVSGHRIDLAWTSGGGTTTGHRIAYDSGNTAPADCASGTTIAESLITGTSHSVTGLTPSTGYSFRVCAINSDDTPAVTAGVTATATTTADVSPPPNPTGFNASAASTTSIDLSWVSGGGTTAGYRIAYAAGAAAPASCDPVSIPENSITGTTHTATGLSAGTQYSFRLCAINANATPDVSSGVTATATTSADVSPPPNPTDFANTFAYPTSIALSWNSGGGSTIGFLIAYQTGATAPGDCSAGTVVSVGEITGTDHTVTGLLSNSQYSFRLCAVAGGEPSPISAGVTVTASTTFEAAPPDPTGFTATAASASAIDLAWTSGDGSTADFRIAYQTGATAPDDCASGTTISKDQITGVSHSVTGLSASTQYAFRVCAINANNPVDVSAGVTATATTNASGGPAINYFALVDKNILGVKRYAGTAGGSFSATTIPGGYTDLVGAALTLDNTENPWIIFSRSSGGTTLDTHLYVMDSGVATNVLYGVFEAGPTDNPAIVWVKSAGEEGTIDVAAGVTRFSNPNYFGTVYSNTRDKGLGTVGTPRELDLTGWTASDPGPVAINLATDFDSKEWVIYEDPKNKLIKYGTRSNLNMAFIAGGNAFNDAGTNGACDGGSSAPAMVIADVTPHYIFECQKGLGRWIIHAWWNGSGWSGEEVQNGGVSTHAGAHNSRLALATDGIKLHAVWWGLMSLMYSSSTIGSGTWSAPVTAASVSMGEILHTPQIALENGKVRLYYVVDDGSQDATIKLWYDNGTSFTTQTVATVTGGGGAKAFLGNGIGIVGYGGNSHR